MKLRFRTFAAGAVLLVLLLGTCAIFLLPVPNDRIYFSLDEALVRPDAVANLHLENQGLSEVPEAVKP